MAVVFSDSFNRANSTNLGPDWEEVGGDFAVIDNRLGLLAYNNPIQAAYVNPISTADYDVQALCGTGSNPKRNPGVFLRGVWNSNSLRYDCYYACIQPDIQAVQLYLFQNGSFTKLAEVIDSGIDATGSTPYTIKLEAQGNTLKVYVDGVLKLTATDSTLTSAGQAGVMAGATRLTLFWDDFVINSLTTAYQETPAFSITSQAAVKDTQQYSESRLVNMVLQLSARDLQHFIDALTLIASVQHVLADYQRYKEFLNSLQATGAAVDDFQQYRETILFLQQLRTGIQIWQKYQEQLSVNTQIFLGVVDNLVTGLQELLSLTIQSGISATDRQRYREAVGWIAAASVAILDLARLLEKLAFRAQSTLSLQDVQTYFEQILATLQSRIDVQDTLIGKIVEQLQLALQMAVDVWEAQTYREALAISLSQLQVIAEVFHPLAPPEALYEFRKILNTLFQRLEKPGDFSKNLTNVFIFPRGKRAEALENAMEVAIPASHWDVTYDPQDDWNIDDASGPLLKVFLDGQYHTISFQMAFQDVAINVVKKAILWLYIEKFQNFGSSNCYIFFHKSCDCNGFQSPSDVQWDSMGYSDVFTGSGEYVDLVGLIPDGYTGWFGMNVTAGVNAVIGQACWGNPNRNIRIITYHSGPDENRVLHVRSFDYGGYTPYLKLYK